jgi:lauroyl/myristoyl acyltransferase
MRIVDRLLCIIAWLAVALIAMMPIRLVAFLGRLGGGIVYHIDVRHRRVAIRNLTQTFSKTKSLAEISGIARENFRRIGENICSAIKFASMRPVDAARFLEVIETVSPAASEAMRARNVVLASGHFGSFELFAHLTNRFPKFRHIATYRGIRQPGLDAFMRGLREKGGITLLDRRTAPDQLKTELSAGGIMLILFADQSDRNNGLELPFLGRPAFTNRAPAVMAVRYDCALFAPICYRIGHGKYRIEMGEPIATRDAQGGRRACEAITRDINSAHEAAVRRDPANWFWVHNRWKQKLAAADNSEQKIGPELCDKATSDAPA